MKSSRVLIIDDDQFPSNDFAEEIGTGREEDLHNVGNRLLMAYIKFTFQRVPTVWWKSILVFALGQLENFYYLGKIYIQVYLVNTLLNIKDPETEDNLIIPGDRASTAAILALIWGLPNLLILFAEWLEAGPLDVGMNCRRHLRVNLFRKYLNYNEAAKTKTSVQDITLAMGCDIPDLVEHGYCMVFSLSRGLGKILFAGFFMIAADTKNIVPLLCFPLIMITFIASRQNKQLKLASNAGDAEAKCQGMLVNAISSFGLIRDYKQRPLLIDKFEEQLNNERRPNLEMRQFNFWNNKVMPWVTICAITLYMWMGAEMVINGESDSGSFLATLSVFKDLGGLFQGVYENLASGLKAIGCLVQVTRLLSAQTDVVCRMDRNRSRRNFMKEKLNEFKAGKLDLETNASERRTVLKKRTADHTSFYDTIPIVFKDLKVGHVESLSHVISAAVYQGSMVFVTGAHGSGKGTIVGILTDNRVPAEGSLLYSSHQRALNVENVPQLMSFLTLYENLTFGTPQPDPMRVRRVFKRVGFHGFLVDKLDQNIAQLQERAAEPQQGKRWTIRTSVRASNTTAPVCATHNVADDDEDDTPWFDRLSYNDKKRLNLARALVFNPEILVLHRPVDDADTAEMKVILQLLREHVDALGVEMDPNTRRKRRPRTCFFTGGEHEKSAVIKNQADVVWTLSRKDGLVITPGGGGLSAASKE